MKILFLTTLLLSLSNYLNAQIIGQNPYLYQNQASINYHEASIYRDLDYLKLYDPNPPVSLFNTGMHPFNNTTYPNLGFIPPIFYGPPYMYQGIPVSPNKVIKRVSTKRKKVRKRKRKRREVEEVQELVDKLDEEPAIVHCKDVPHSQQSAHYTPPVQKTHRNYGDTDKKALHNLHNNLYLKRCVEGAVEAQEVKVDKNVEFPCSSTITRGVRKKYTLKVEHGLPILSTSIYLNYKGDSPHEGHTLAEIDNIKSCMNDFFATSGIKLDINFTNDPKHQKTCDHDVELRQHGVRGTSAHSNAWFTDSLSNSDHSKKQNLTHQTSCSLTLHEFGHLLGLDDTYKDPDCPLRKDTALGASDSLMGNKAARGVSSIQLYPYQLKQIFKPLCGD